MGLLQRLLVVDDEADVRRVLQLMLEDSGYEVWAADSGAQALELIQERGLPHLALLDIIMPEMNGLDLARRLLTFSDVPIIFLSAVDEQDTVVQAIEELAEDYVTKPFHPPELVARVRRVLRRMGTFAYTLEPVTAIDERVGIDFVGSRLVVEGAEIKLTPTETKILHILAQRAGRIVTSDFLLSRVWPLEDIFEDTLRVHIHRLRKKIEPRPDHPEYLSTERGVGYSFRAP